MAITKSAKKAHRASLKRRVFNIRRQRVMLSAVKDAKKTSGAESLSKAYQAIDKALKRGIIKKNTAARKKSRLVKALRRKEGKK